MTAFLHSQVTAIPNQRNAALTNHTVSRSNCPRSQKTNLKRSMAIVNTGIRSIVRSNSNITSDFKGERMRFSLSVSSRKITENKRITQIFKEQNRLKYSMLSVKISLYSHLRITTISNPQLRLLSTNTEDTTPRRAGIVFSSLMNYWTTEISLISSSIISGMNGSSSIAVNRDDDRFLRKT